MSKAWVLMAGLLLVAAGLQAQDEERLRDNRRQQGEVRPGRQGQGRLQLPGMLREGAGMDALEPFLDRILDRLEEGTLSEEMRPLAEELRLVRLKLRSVESQLQVVEESLLENAELVALYQAYQAAAKEYTQAVAGNERIRAAKAKLAELERGRGEMMAGMRGGDENARREAFQKLREQMEEQRRLNEEVAAETKQNEAIVKAAQARAAAAAAVMKKYQELLAQNARAQALKADQEFLRGIQQELMSAARTAMGGETGMFQRPDGGRRGGERAPGVPTPPENPAGLDAF